MADDSTTTISAVVTALVTEVTNAGESITVFGYLTPHNVTVVPSMPMLSVLQNSGQLFCNKSVKAYAPIEKAFYGYGLPCLSLFGVIANILNIIVLTDRRLSARTYTYLAFLAFTDLLTLILYFVDLLAKIHFAGQLWHEIFTAYIYLPIGSVTTTSSLLLTVAFTVDRFIYVRDPKIQTGKMSHREKVIIQVFSSCLIIMSAVINVPRMFALSVDFNTGCRAYRDYAKSSKGWFGVYSYIRLALLNVGSIIILAVFNVMLIVLVHRSSARSHRDSINSSGRSQASQQRSLSLTLIAATLLALAGEIPSTLFNRTSAAVLWGSPAVLDKQPFKSLFLLAYTLLLLEYSGKVVTYFLLNKKFRNLLFLKIWPSMAENNPKYMTEFERTSRCPRLSTASAPLLARNSTPVALLSSLNPSNFSSNPNMTHYLTTNGSSSVLSSNAPATNSLLVSESDSSPLQSPTAMPTIEERDERSIGGRISFAKDTGIVIRVEADTNSEVV